MAQPRLVPIVMLAASALLGLKVVAFLHGDLGVKAAEIVAGSARDPFRGVAVDPIITGSGGGGHGEAPPADAGGHGGAAPASTAPGVEPSKVPTTVSKERPEEAKPIPGTELLSEVEILKRLAERRKQLDKLEEDLTMRENLLKATEDKVGKRVEELQQLEVKSATGVKDAAADQKKQLGDLVKMYEAMKPKDAARVFDGLDPKLLVDIARQMNPKKLADVVAKMSPEVAQRLTVELARPDGPAPAANGEAALPKIQGKS
jgi:flagellar motility protein MotE (MotC chaperone)